jgi:hypothetical protein
MANRTIQFCGYAYGNVPVQLNAHINGQTVFSGTVATLNENIPLLAGDWSTAPVLFSIPESALFPTSFSGSYPMTVSVATGYGIILAYVNSNYMLNASNQVEFSGSISGTTLNVSSVTSGEISIGQTIYDNVITAGTTIVSGLGSTWQINNSQTTSEATINGAIFNPGTVDAFSPCFNGTPTNSDNTVDSRSSVQINGVPQTPPRDSNSYGQWTWLVEAGSTIEYNFNVSVGNE